MESNDDGWDHVLEPETDGIIFYCLLPSSVADENFVQKFESLSGLWHLKDFAEELQEFTK